MPENQLKGWLWIPGLTRNHYYPVGGYGDRPLCGNGNAIILNTQSEWARPRPRNERMEDCKTCRKRLERSRGER